MGWSLIALQASTTHPTHYLPGNRAVSPGCLHRPEPGECLIISNKKNFQALIGKLRGIRIATSFWNRRSSLIAQKLDFRKNFSVQ